MTKHSLISKAMVFIFCLANVFVAKAAQLKTLPVAGGQPPLLLPMPRNTAFTGKTIPLQRIRIQATDFPEATPRLVELLKHKGVKIDQAQQWKALKIQFKKSADLKGEAYTIKIEPKQVTVLSSSEVGIFNGIHTLVQLFQFVEGKWVIPEGKITDSPAMKMRGVYMNLRGMQANKKTITGIKAIFSAFAEMKINTLVLEFADYIKYDSVKFPKTEKKAFSKSQIKELIQYANNLHMEIIPYFQILAHCTWVLSNPDNLQLLENPKRRGWAAALCPSNPKTNEFLDAILTETIDLFHPKYIHIAMDELDQGGFHRDKACKKQTPSQLLKKTIMNIYNLLKSHDVQMMIYQDQLLYYPNRYTRKDVTEGWKIVDSLPKDIVINIWDYSTDLKEMRRQRDYFTTKGFKVLGSCFSRFNNIKMISQEYSEAIPQSLGMTVTYWHLVGNWPMLQVSPTVAAMTTLTAAYSWNPGKLPRTTGIAFDPVAEFVDRCLRTPSNLSDLAQKSVFLPANGLVGNFFGNWPGEPLERNLAPLPLTITNRGITFNLRKDQTLLTVSGKKGDGFPLQAQKINVNLKAKYLAFLHASGIPQNARGLNYIMGHRKMPLIGNYQIRYANGKTVDIPLKYRWNITDWNSELSPVSGHTVYVDTSEEKSRFQLCSYLWTNPFPQEVISTITLSSTYYENVNIACLAVTVLDSSAQPTVLDDFSYDSIQAFKKIWTPTMPMPLKNDGITFEHSSNPQDESVLVLTIPANTVSDRINLDKDLVVNKELLLTRNLKFTLETNAAVRMGFYLGDGTPSWNTYRARYFNLKKGTHSIIVSPPGLFKEQGNLSLDHVKKLRLVFYRKPSTPAVTTTLKIHPMQWIYASDRKASMIKRHGSWFDNLK